ncbi:MAG: YihA family ribosome biogenesis GTP-binding protein [Gemmatimonadales bacterium]|nr:YihA family ribosome biogenesis GTP-binding protein [Gemmatimonadales bacterium]
MPRPRPQPDHSATPRVSPLRNLPVEFVGSFPDPAVLLDPALPELAFVGRSNVGKSSLINALLARRRLARVSGTPGKTTLINVYRLPSFYLVDLPGYGWARASKKARASYRSLVRGYLQNRTTLHGVVWLLDIRHPPSVDDREMQDLLAEAGHAVLAVITKADKLGLGARGERVRALTEALELNDDQVQLVSSTTGLGIADLGTSLLAAVDG